LVDILRYPSLSEEELAKIKIEWNSRFVESKMSTKSMAWNKLRQSLYPADHVFYDKDFDKQIEELAAVTRADLVAAHERLYSPSATIITIVGDIEPKEALKLVEQRFGDWQDEKLTLKPAERQIEIPLVSPPEKAFTVEVFLPEKPSLDIVMAHPCAVRRDSPDFYAARIANAALGQDTITSRLGQVVRDRAGLTYGIYSGFSDTAYGGAPWTVSLTTNPKNVARALQLTRATLKDYIDRGIDKNDLEKESGRALGSFKVGLSSSLGIARVITEFEFLGLGVGELDKISSRYIDLTKEQVDEAMQRYFHPERMVTVLSGSIVK
ncbi:MAG TPA: pitrilysin family protein, partial [Candidatus Obscuribacter sp.]|nr:pitrilysin family protein [Candidatus Obscuribacter sp.]